MGELEERDTEPMDVPVIRSLRLRTECEWPPPPPRPMAPNRRAAMFPSVTLES